MHKTEFPRRAASHFKSRDRDYYAGSVGCASEAAAIEAVAEGLFGVRLDIV